MQRSEDTCVCPVSKLTPHGASPGGGGWLAQPCAEQAGPQEAVHGLASRFPPSNP